ncbi:TniQ family protein [Paenibacillus plantarum]|nr:TniQ family protein [Paenibacillus plantarum]
MNRPFCYEDESVEGYFYRVSKANYISINHLNDFINPYYKKGIGDLERVMLWMNDDNMHIYNRNSIHFINNNGLQQHNFRPKLYSKFCPSCINEQPYHRVHWLIAPVIICRKHNLDLLHQCECSNPVTYKDVIEDQCPNCKMELSACSARQTYLDDDSKNSMMLFDKIRDEGEVWNNLTIIEYYQVLKRIRWFLTYHMKDAISINDRKYDLKKDRNNWHVGNNLVFYWMIKKSVLMTSDWPENFVKFYYEVSSSLKAKFYSLRYYVEVKTKQDYIFERFFTRLKNIRDSRM